MLTSDKVIVAHCQTVITAWFKSPLEVASDLVEISAEAYHTKGLHIARILVSDQQEVPVRVLNATHGDQVLSQSTIPGS
jgi:hypothetical protein